MTDWRRSSHCEAGQCVEVATEPDGVLMRDSKLDDSPVIVMSPGAWMVFTADVKAGRLDGPC